MKTIEKLILDSSVIGFTGFILLAIVDWKIALGVFLWSWSINIDNRVKQIKMNEANNKEDVWI